MPNSTVTRWSVAAAVLVVAVLCYVLLSSARHPAAGGEDGAIGGDFTLISHEGEVALNDFRDKVVLLYFGFLNCPDVCPTSMGVVESALRRMNDTELAQVQPLLVSIDPKRDTPEALAQFTQFYHPSIIGLTGSEAALQAVAAAYGAFFEKQIDDDDALNTIFRHSSRYYVINKDGQLVDAMRHSTTTNELLARIRTLI